MPMAGFFAATLSTAPAVEAEPMSAAPVEILTASRRVMFVIANHPYLEHLAIVILPEPFVQCIVLRTYVRKLNGGCLWIRWIRTQFEPSWQLRALEVLVAPLIPSAALSRPLVDGSAYWSKSSVRRCSNDFEMELFLRMPAQRCFLMPKQCLPRSKTVSRQCAGCRILKKAAFHWRSLELLRTPHSPSR